MYPMLNESPFHMYVLCAEAKPIVAAAMKALSMLAKWTWEVVWFLGVLCVMVWSSVAKTRSLDFFKTLQLLIVLRFKTFFMSQHLADLLL